MQQEKEMTRAEYEKLIATAKENGNLRLAMIIEIIGSTGMRISELASVTVEAVSTGKISISCKGKHREIYLIPKLKRKLLDYCKRKTSKAEWYSSQETETRWTAATSGRK